MQMATSGPVSPYPEIMQGYVRAILSAKKYVYIETPYFLPTDSVFFAMKTAAASGVDVRVLVPRHCDAHFVQWANHSYLREAVEAGIKVFLYEPGFLHSKLMVCDDSISTCGSTNVDFRSFENNFEGNMFFYDAAVAQRFKAVFLDDEAQATPLNSLPSLMHPNIARRLWDSLTRLLSPLL
jgi:cardiolipin synthase